QMDSVTVTSSEPVTGLTPFELSLTLAHVEDGTGTLRGELEYAADLFDRTTAERLVQHLLELLRTVAMRPSIALNYLNLPMLGGGDQRVAEPNGADAGAAGEPPLMVHDLFERQAAAPEAPAVRDGATVLSYGDLERRSRAIAAVLRARGVGPESRVGIA